MKASLKELERNVKTDRAGVLIIAIVIILCVIEMILEISSLMSYEPSDFSIHEETLKSGIVTSSLYIDGEEYGEIYTNNYTLENAEGNTDIRAMAVMSKVRTIVREMMMAAILVLVYLLFQNCRKMKTPFTKRAVLIVRLIAILTIAMTLLPEVVFAVASMAVFSYGIFDINSADIDILWLGAAFGMIAEIFRYGTALQEDSDSIA